jgi:flagellar biosynthesis/type III secretory pathway M-ring protein FliF/YscJ
VAAEYFNRELEYRIKTFTTLFEPIMIIFVGVIVLFLVLVFLSKKVIERAERKHLDHDGPDEASVADMKD